MEVTNFMSASASFAPPQSAAKAEVPRTVEAREEVHAEAPTVEEVREASEKARENGQSAVDKNKRLTLGLPGEKALQKAVSDLNKVIEPIKRKFDLSVHEKTGRILVKVLDVDTDEVVREIPDKETLDFLASVLEQQGVLVDKKG